MNKHSLLRPGSRRNAFQALAILFALGAPFAAHASAAAGGMTPGRLGALAAAAVGLASVIIGRLALARSARGTGSARIAAIAALATGLVGVALSVLHLARSSGGFGTGGGRAGAIVALVVGVAGTILGWRALARSRRNATGGGTLEGGRGEKE